MAAASSLESLLKRERAIVLAGLAGATALAWAYLIALAAETADMPAAAMRAQPWDAAEFVLMFMMWAVMMAGMMLPGAAPMILLFALVARKNREGGMPYVPTGAFAAGYLLAWTAFSLFATALQWGLNRAALLSPMMVSTSPVLGGLLLIAAGVFQWTPLKHACLRHCRSPVGFVVHHWRPGAAGALRMGIEHGVFCLGCCWFLMGLLFVGGVMNLLWVAAITVFVLAEKAAPRGERVARIAGGAMMAAGVALLLAR